MTHHLSTEGHKFLDALISRMRGCFCPTDDPIDLAYIYQKLHDLGPHPIPQFIVIGKSGIPSGRFI